MNGIVVAFEKQPSLNKSGAAFIEMTGVKQLRPKRYQPEKERPYASNQR
jgi:predicted aminopeptidase